MRVFFQGLSGRIIPAKVLSVAAICIAIILSGSKPCWSDTSGVTYGFSGYTAFQAGEIVRGQYKNARLNNRWQERLLGGFNIEATVNQRLKVAFGPECMITQAIYDNPSNTEKIIYDADIESSHGYSLFYLNQMQGIYSFGDLDAPYLQIALGYFPFTYNPDIKSLGEYLFRATAYPGFIINDFASVYKRLAGLHVQAKPIQNLKLDFLLTTELQSPVGDFTPSLLGSYGFGGEENHPAFEFGAGISLTRLLQVDPHLTTPRYNSNLLVINQDTIPVAVNDSVPAHDSITAGDSIYFSFASTKLMGRFSFDPKQLFGNPTIFGDEDLKIYAEACILGTKNYPVYYDSIMKRIPMMVGFNFPTFRILDVLSIEVEWYNNKYSNNYDQTYTPREKTPLPTLITNNLPEPKPYPWYWSVHARKTIVKGLQMLGEVGRNHYFMQCKYPNYQDRREETPVHGDWQFIVRAQYSF